MEKVLVMSNFSFSHSVFYPFGWLSCNEQFLFFPQCFLSFWMTLCYFCQIWNCRLQTVSVWKSLKFVVWERINIMIPCNIMFFHNVFKLVHAISICSYWQSLHDCFQNCVFEIFSEGLYIWVLSHFLKLASVLAILKGTAFENIVGKGAQSPFCLMFYILWMIDLIWARLNVSYLQIYRNLSIVDKSKILNPMKS